MVKRAPPQVITPLPPIDVTKLFPELRKLAAKAVRLHPIEGKPAVESSHVGAPILWPASEPWPTTEDKQYPLLGDFVGGRFKQIRKPNRTLVAVLQLRKEDVPELEFPKGRDLFQLLWNPRAHPSCGYAPLIETRWRRARDVQEVLDPQPTAELPEEELVPRPCTLSPERVTEYPDKHDMPAELGRKVVAFDDTGDDDEREPIYQYALSMAPGIKVGGFPVYAAIDPVYPRCAKKHPMVFLLTIDGTEWQGGAGQRWRGRRGRKALANNNPTGLRVGRDGALHLYICRRCAAWPISTVLE